MSDPAGAREFLCAVWGGGEGVAELDLIDPSGKIKPSAFSYPKDLDKAIAWCDSHKLASNVYYGICLRKPGTKIGWSNEDKKTYRGSAEDALSSGCVWIDVDFSGENHKGKTLDRDAFKAALKAFQLPPSAVVLSGGGVHVYWLLREPASGEDLKRVVDVNVALSSYFGADRQTTDLARILRVPNTFNHKALPAKPVSISYWRPERRYNLLDFDFLPRAVAVPAAAKATQIDAGQHSGVELPPKAKERLQGILAEIWINGYRHALALYLSGAMAHAGVRVEDAREVIAGASDAVGGSTDKRMKDVEDSYRDYYEGRMVGGTQTLLKKIEDATIRDRVRAAWESAKKSLPKSKGDVKTNFRVAGQIKYNSRPARYVTTIRYEDKDYVITCETDVFHNFKAFRRLFFEETRNKSLTMVSDFQWERMADPDIAGFPFEVLEAPKEASVVGAIEAALDDFLENKKESPDYGALRTFPGYDDSTVYFTLSAFKESLKERGIKSTDREIIHTLDRAGWQNGRRRIGGYNPRLWVKSLGQNGTATPEGGSLRTVNSAYIGNFQPGGARDENDF